MTSHRETQRGSARKNPTPDSLTRAAEYYLARFAASESSLRRVLNTRLRRVAMSNPDFAANRELQAHLKSAIETIIENYKHSGIINDGAYAEMKRSSLRRAGRSRSAIKQKLQAKGLAAGVIDQALAEESDEENAELTAALIFAKRKKIGRYATVSVAADQQKKQIAAMARAGFKFGIIKRIINVTDDLPPDEP